MSHVDPVSLRTQARTQRKSVARLNHLVRRSLALVWQAAPRSSGLLIGLQILGALALGAQVLVVQATLSAILDVSNGTAGFRALLAPIAALASLTALTAVAGSLQRSLGRMVGESVVAVMWRRVLDVATSVDMKLFESSTFFDRLQRVQTSALTRPYQVTQGIVATVGAVAASVGVVVAIVSIHPGLLPLLLLGGVPILLTSRRESRLEFDFTVRQTPQIRMRTYLTVLQTGRDEAKEVRVFGLAAYLRQRFDGIYQTYLHDLAGHLRRRSLLNIGGNLGSAVVFAGTLFLLVWLISEGRISIAAAGAAIVAIRLLAGQLQAAFGGVQAIFESGLFIDDLDAFLAMGPTGVTEADRVPPEDFTSIEAVDLSFTYPGNSALALDGVDISIRAGEIVALVGENGSGKTTLAKVMAGLYEPDSGTVLWDGRDARTFRRDLQQRRTAVIFQDFVRYAFTAEENIAISRPEEPLDQPAVRRAAQVVDADGFLSTLPSGYETPLSRLFVGGQELSGGQWQRVAIARAFYRNAPLVILDEPSASLDPRAEYELFSSLRQVLAGRTALFISHRFSTVRSADRIYVLDEGKVIERGTHDELMGLDGHYAELFRLQAAAYLLQD